MPAYVFRGPTTTGTGAGITMATPIPAYAASYRIRPLPTYDVVGTYVIGSTDTGPADVTPPITVFVSETVTKVSAVAGFDQTTVTWSVDEDCQAWQIREVANAADTIAVAGQLVASGGAVAASVNRQTTITNTNLSTGDGTKLLKVFAQDLAGNWST